MTKRIKPDKLSRELNKSGRDYTRELVRQRDNRTCQMCGKVWVIGQRRFDIHHLFDCGNKSRAYDSVNNMDDLITYCHKCHLGLESVRRKISSRTGNYKNSPEALRSKAYGKRVVDKVSA